VLCLDNEINIHGKFAPKGISEQDFRLLFESAGNDIVAKNDVPKPKTVTPNEVVGLVRQLVSHSAAYKKEITRIVA
jgi:hypothetical protein